MAQTVKCLTLDVSSGHDPTAHVFEPHVGMLRAQSLLGIHSFSLSLPPPPSKYINFF